MKYTTSEMVYVPGHQNVIGYRMCDNKIFNEDEISVIYRSYFARGVLPVDNNKEDYSFTMLFFIMMCEGDNIDFEQLHEKLKGYAK